MILYPPLVFDGNEWFTIFAGTLIWAIMLSLPRRFNDLMMMMIWLGNHFLAEVVDFTIAVPPINLYDTHDWPQYEIFDLIIYIFLYPPSAYLALYMYDKWRFTGWKLVLYIVACALVSTGLEAISLWFHVFTYYGWKLIYSFPVYMVVFSLNIALYHFVLRKTTA